MEDVDCESFAFHWIDRELATLFSEMYWEHDYSSERAWQFIRDEATRRNVRLTDANNWDYDRQLWDAYRNDPDKGLS